MSRSVDFFENQSQRQVKAGEFDLNPFERSSVDYVHGTVFDFGSGLGTLAIEAARRGFSVIADSPIRGLGPMTEFTPGLLEEGQVS